MVVILVLVQYGQEEEEEEELAIGKEQLEVLEMLVMETIMFPQSDDLTPPVVVVVDLDRLGVMLDLVVPDLFIMEVIAAGLLLRIMVQQAAEQMEMGMVLLAKDLEELPVLQELVLRMV